MKAAYIKEMQERLRASLWATISRRYYLLKMKAKYAGKSGLLFSSSQYIIIYVIDGQKITKKLSKGITKDTSTARKFLEELNNISQTDEAVVPLCLDDVLSPESEFWQCPRATASEIPVNIKRDIIEAYLLLKRCDEELVLLRSEMHNVIDYYDVKEKKIISVLQKFTGNELTQFQRGCISLLKKLQREVHHFRSITVCL